MRFVFAILASLLMCVAAVARPPTDRELNQLSAAFDLYASSLISADGRGAVDAMPPRIVLLLAEMMELSVDDAKAELGALLETAFTEQMSFQSVAADLEGVDVTDHIDEAGAVYAWVFLPVWIEATYEGAPVSLDSQVLALLDNGRWYFLRSTDEGQIALLRETYPFFQSVTFP